MNTSIHTAHLRTMLGIALAFCMVSAFARTGTTARVTPQQPVNSLHAHNDGWVMFDDTVSAALGLGRDQLQRLRNVDTEYRSAYLALGEQPTKNPKYVALTAQREEAVRKVLTPEQYTNWTRRYPSLPVGAAPVKKE